MKILQIVKKFPYPLVDGESWAIIGLAKGLKSQGTELDLLSLNTEKHQADYEAREMLNDLSLYKNISIIDVSVRPKILSALSNLTGRKSYHEQRYNKQDIHNKITQETFEKTYDVIIAESLYTVDYAYSINKLGHAKAIILLRAHNIEHLIWSRYAIRLKGLKAWYFKNQAKRLKEYESKIISKCDAILTVSDYDKDVFKGITKKVKHIISIPIAMDTLQEPEYKTEDLPFIIGFIGSLDWRPNIEGLEWFLTNIWDDFSEDYPESIFMIAGRNAKRSINLRHHNNMTWLGEIEDSDSFLSQIDVLVCPLFSGSGTRVKVLQSMRAHTPVVGSKIAFEGLSLTHDVHVLEADTKEEWNDALKRIHSRENVDRLVLNSESYLDQYHNTNELGARVLRLIEKL